MILYFLFIHPLIFSCNFKNHFSDPIKMSALREITHLEGHKDRVTCISVPEDGQTLFYTSSRDKKVYAWTSEPESFAIIKKAYEESRHYVNCVNSSKTGEIIAGGADSIVRIYPQGKKLVHKREVTAIALNTAEDKIVTGSLDGSLSLWNTEGTLMSELVDVVRPWVTCAAFKPNTDVIVAGYSDGGIRVWDVDSGKLLNVFFKGKKEVQEATEVSMLSITPDGTYCAFGGRDCEVYILNLENGALIRVLKTNSEVVALAFALTEPIIAVSTKTHIHVWDVVNDKILADLSNADIGSSLWCTSLAWCKNVLLAGISNGVVKGYELNRGEEMN